MKAGIITKHFVLLIHALAGWAVCGAIMGIGMNVAPLRVTLIVHAIGAPTVFAALSWIYFQKFSYTTPLHTAIFFLSSVILMDVFVVTLLIQRSLEMFRSIVGTWLPFALIFTSTYLVGSYLTRRV